MKKTQLSRLLFLIGCIVLITAIALTTIGCDNSNTSSVPESQAELSDTSITATVMGEGNTVFYFTVTDLDGQSEKFEIHTNDKTVGQALTRLGLISGNEGPYGLEVKTVNGKTYDFNKDGKYWAFYINGAYAMTGVDSTDITANAEYAFKAE